MVPIPIEELAKRADLVVWGTVESKSCQRDEKGRIYTKVDLAVKEVWKGRAQTNLLTLVQGGGILGEERVVVSGQTDYAIDEEVVAFLVFNPAGEPVTLGMSQGKFRVWQDKRSGQKCVANPFHGTGKIDAVPTAAAAEAVPAAGLLTLENLKQQVRK